MLGLFGKKIGMTQIFGDQGSLIPVTVIEANPCPVVQVKNLTNDYQQEFDTLKDRDSNFIYGPSLPRTIYFGLVLKSL